MSKRPRVIINETCFFLLPLLIKFKSGEMISDKTILNERRFIEKYSKVLHNIFEVYSL